MKNRNDNLDFLDLLLFSWSNKRIFILSVLPLLFSATLFVILTPPKYQSDLEIQPLNNIELEIHMPWLVTLNQKYDLRLNPEIFLEQFLSSFQGHFNRQNNSHNLMLKSIGNNEYSVVSSTGTLAEELEKLVLISQRDTLNDVLEYARIRLGHARDKIHFKIQKLEAERDLLIENNQTMVNGRIKFLMQEAKIARTLDIKRPLFVEPQPDFARENLLPQPSQYRNRAYLLGFQIIEAEIESLKAQQRARILPYPKGYLLQTNIDMLKAELADKSNGEYLEKIASLTSTTNVVSLNLDDLVIKKTRTLVLLPASILGGLFIGFLIIFVNRALIQRV